MKIQHPLLVNAVGVTGAWLVRRLVGTSRFHFRYADPMVNPEVARRLGHRYIYAFYHEVMLFPAYYWAWPEMNILISDHRDGELITQVVRRLGFGVVRGSTTRGGARALREMTHRIDRGNLCVTPDGPKGPRRHVHQGLIYLASRTGLPIVGRRDGVPRSLAGPELGQVRRPAPASRGGLCRPRTGERSPRRRPRHARSLPPRSRAPDAIGHDRGRGVGRAPLRSGRAEVGLAAAGISRYGNTHMSCRPALDRGTDDLS